MKEKLFIRKFDQLNDDFFIGDYNLKDPSYKEYVYQFRHLTDKELDSFPRKFKFKYSP